MNSSENALGKCNVCGSDALQEVLSLPNFPLNSRYVDSSSCSNYLADFTLSSCTSCFHLQGVSGFPLSSIYNADYDYASGGVGVSARQRWLLGKVAELAEGRKFNRVIEIGCNNFSLMRGMQASKVVANHWIGIDPVPLTSPADNGVTFINGYTQDVEIPHFDPLLPDLVVADQVLEHLPSLNDFLADINNRVGAGTIYFICVPSLELLVENLSFHNIIHEHLNYFSGKSLVNLFEANGLTLQMVELNNAQTAGYLLQVWEKSDTAKSFDVPFADPAALLVEFDDKYRYFKESLRLTIGFLERHAKEGSTYGFGASDITSNLAYFAESDFSMLDRILDDTAYKQNKYMPLIKPMISATDSVSNLSNAVVFLTAPQAARPIVKRLTELNVRKIILPFSVI